MGRAVRRDLAGDGHGAGGQSFCIGGIRPPFRQRRQSVQHRSHLESVRSYLFQQRASCLEALASSVQVSAIHRHVPEVVERYGHFQAARGLTLLENQRALQVRFCRLGVASVSREVSKSVQRRRRAEPSRRQAFLECEGSFEIVLARG